MEMIQRENQYYKIQNEKLRNEIDNLNKVVNSIKGKLTKFDYDFNGGWGKKHSNIIMPISPKCLLFTEIGTKFKTPIFDCSREWSEYFRKEQNYG